MQSVNQNIMEIGKKIGEKLNMLTKFSLYAIILILLIIILFQKCNHNKEIKQINKIAEQNYIAIQDSFKLIKKTDKEIVYVDRTPILPTNKDNKDNIFTSAINISSSNKKTDTVFISGLNHICNTDTSNLKDIIINDTLPHLYYKLSLKPSNGLFIRNFEYKYNADLKIELNKDKKGYYTKITSDDTNLNLSGNSIYYQKTKKEIRQQKLKRAGLYIGSAIIFSSGIYLGTKF